MEGGGGINGTKFAATFDKFLLTGQLFQLYSPLPLPIEGCERGTSHFQHFNSPPHFDKSHSHFPFPFPLVSPSELTALTQLN